MVINMSKKIHLIGNAHLDPVWLWRWQEGFAEIKATFRSALDRMKEFNDFHFTSACAVYYEWVEKSDPAMFEEIKERIKEGRWHIAGGWFLQPDCNIPCGESFARHGLISQRYFKDKFGVIAKTGYNADSFGHNGNIPQILKKSGMDNYVFMRPASYEKKLAQDCFIWESMDGSSVKTFRIPFLYNIDYERYDHFEKVEELAEEQNIDFMAFYGVGNHGGGPTVQLLDRICEENKENYVFSDCESYFNSMDDKELPIVKGDLQFHAKGCYSACSKIKKDNRICEHNLLTAEKYSVIANKLLGEKYPAKALKKAWKNVLFNQFHDIMGGCSIKDEYTDAAYLHGEAMSITEQVINFAMQQISWNIDTTGGVKISGNKGDCKIWQNEQVGTPVVVFNPLPWAVNKPVRLNAIATRVTTEDGTELPIQQIRGKQTNGGEDKYDTLFAAEIPAMGYRTYRMFMKTEQTVQTVNVFSNTDSSMENEFIKVTFDKKTMELSSITEKKTGKELLSGSCKAVLTDDIDNDTWAHGTRRFKDRIGTFRVISLNLIENGPVRSVIRAKAQYGNSVLRRDYILYAGKPELEVRAAADFREKHAVLKLEFPVNAEKPQALCEIPYGFIERSTDGDEHVCGQWFTLTNQGTDGIGIANDSKYSFDAENNIVSLTVLRSAIYADHYGVRDEFCEFMEQGIQEFAYTIFPYHSMSDTVRRAYELNTEPRHIIETFHKGGLAAEFEGVEISAGNIILTAMKQAENGKGVIIRCYEAENRDTKADISVKVLNAHCTVEFAHNEVKTLFIDNKGNAEETNLIEDDMY